MKRILLVFLLLITLVGQSFGALQDLTTLTYVGTAGTVLANSITVTSFESKNETWYGYRSIANNDVDISVALELVAADVDEQYGILGVSSVIGDLTAQLTAPSNDTIAVYISTQAAVGTYINLISSKNGVYVSGVAPYQIFPGQKRWIRLKKIGTAVSAEIYSDFLQTNLLSTIVLTLPADDSYTLEYVSMSVNDATPVVTVSAVISDFVGADLDRLIVDETPQKIYSANDSDISDVDLTGSYTATVPTGLEYQLLNESNDAVIQIGGNDWNTMTGVTIGSGVWDATAPNIPADLLWYKISVRMTNAPLLIGETTEQFGVGYRFLYAGQSLAYAMFHDAYGVTPSEFTQMLPFGSTDGRDWIAVSGAGARTLCNQLSISLNRVVGIVEGGVNGAGLESKNNPTDYFYTGLGTENALYTSIKTAVNAIGGDLDFFHYHQGSTDTLGDTSTYQTAEADFFNNQIRSDFSYSKTGILPIGNSLLGPVRTATAVKVDAVNTAKLKNFDDGVVDYLVTPIDQTFADGIHTDAPGYIVIAGKVGRAIEVQEGIETTYRSPRGLGFLVVDTTTTDIIIDFDFGADFTPTTGIDIFDVNTGTLGSPVWITSTGVRLDATTVRLTHIAGTVVEARCLYGEEPGTTNIIIAGTSLLPIFQESSLGVTSTTTVTFTITGAIDGRGIIDSTEYSNGAVVNITPGTVNITWLNVYGYDTPEPQSFTAVAGNNYPITGSYTETISGGGSGGWGGSPWGS